MLRLKHSIAMIADRRFEKNTTREDKPYEQTPALSIAM